MCYSARIFPLRQIEIKLENGENLKKEMDPLTIAAIALGIVATKSLEKTTENVTDVVWTKSQDFIAALKKYSPATATAIEQAPEQPLDYGEAVLEVEAAAANNAEVKETMEALATGIEVQKIPGLTKVLQEIVEALNKNPKVSETYSFEKLGSFTRTNYGTINNTITL
ncbi:MAG: hypothetical protein AB4290_09315 [Spirulina sp.]